MKKNYCIPQIMINIFGSDNVITASGGSLLADELEKKGVDKNYLTDKNISEVQWVY